MFGEVRTAGTSEEPLFCLADVCKALGLTSKGVAQRLSNEVISNYPLSTAGGIQQALFVNEDGLYDVILDSRKPVAKKFRKWVASEVLPSIRKSGGYIATRQEDTPEEIMARALAIAQETLAKRENRIAQLEAETAQQQVAIESKDATITQQTEEMRKQAPKVSYYDDVLQSVNTMTSTQVAKSLGMEVRSLNKKLQEIGVIYRQSGMWMLKSPYSGWKMSATRTQTFTRSDGSTGTSSYTVWNERGRRFIVALSENEWNVKAAIKAINGKEEAR